MQVERRRHGHGQGQRGSTALKVLVGAVGALVSLLLALNVFFRWHLHGTGPLLTPRFSGAEFITEIPRNLTWILPFAILSGCTLVLRSVQWQRTLTQPVPFKERYHLVAIGAFVHNALPGKLGDITRSFLLARTQKLPFVEALGSVAVCKLLEGLALLGVLAVACLGPLGHMLGPFAHALHVAVLIAAVLLALAVALARYARPLARKLEHGRRFPRLHKLLIELAQGFKAAHSPRALVVALLYSVLPVLAPALAYGLGLEGLGIHNGLWAGPIVVGAIALGQSVLVVPAGTGLYYFMTGMAARALGASDAQAAAFAFLTHLTTVLTQVGMGAVSLWVRKIRWRDLLKRTHQAEDAEEAVDQEELAPILSPQ